MIRPNITLRMLSSSNPPIQFSFWTLESATSSKISTKRQDKASLMPENIFIRPKLTMENKKPTKLKRTSKTQTLTTMKNGMSSINQPPSPKTKKTVSKKSKINSHKNSNAIKRLITKSRCPEKELWIQTYLKLSNKFTSAILESSVFQRLSSISWNFSVKLMKITSILSLCLLCNFSYAVFMNLKLTLKLLKRTLWNTWKKLRPWLQKNKNKWIKVQRMSIKKIKKQVSISKI